MQNDRKNTDEEMRLKQKITEMLTLAAKEIGAKYNREAFGYNRKADFAILSRAVELMQDHRPKNMTIKELVHMIAGVYLELDLAPNQEKSPTKIRVHADALVRKIENLAKSKLNNSVNLPKSELAKLKERQNATLNKLNEYYKNVVEPRYYINNEFRYGSGSGDNNINNSRYMNEETKVSPENLKEFQESAVKAMEYEKQSLFMRTKNITFTRA